LDALAKRVQRELYQRLFTDQPWMPIWPTSWPGCATENSMKSSFYHKNLRKGTEDYTATTRRTSRRPQVEPAPRPVDPIRRHHGGRGASRQPDPSDRSEHYVEKQVRPVAEPVLGTLGLDFATVIGDTRQIDSAGDPPPRPRPPAPGVEVG